MNKRLLGILLILLSISFAFVTLKFKGSEDFLSEQIIQLNEGSCILENGFCLHNDRDYSNYYLGVFSAFVLLILGAVSLYEFYYAKPVIANSEKVEIKMPLDLDNDEKILFNIIKENNGSVYQSDLIKKTEFSKVKVTRILDRMESRKLVERKRRGMANIIILK